MSLSLHFFYLFHPSLFTNHPTPLCLVFSHQTPSHVNAHCHCHKHFSFPFDIFFLLACFLVVVFTPLLCILTLGSRAFDCFPPFLSHFLMLVSPRSYLSCSPNTYAFSLLSRSNAYCIVVLSFIYAPRTMCLRTFSAANHLSTPTQFSSFLVRLKRLMFFHLHRVVQFKLSSHTLFLSSLKF